MALDWRISRVKCEKKKLSVEEGQEFSSLHCKKYLLNIYNIPAILLVVGESRIKKSSLSFKSTYSFLRKTEVLAGIVTSMWLVL